jgi:hypothetical protein
MINFKKGPALSLHQVNYIGSAKTDENVVAGMIVQVKREGSAINIVRGVADADKTSKDILYGFAINSQTSGDVIESGKIGVYALDGASVIETDQFEDITIADIGKQVCAIPYLASDATPANAAKAGKIKLVSAGERAIGQVEGVRDLPNAAQTYNGVRVQGVTTVVAVKLFS